MTFAPYVVLPQGIIVRTADDGRSGSITSHRKDVAANIELLILARALCRVTHGLGLRVRRSVTPSCYQVTWALEGVTG